MIISTKKPPLERVYIALSHQMVVGGVVIFEDYLNDKLEFDGGQYGTTKYI